MFACIDTYYTDNDSRTAVLLFECWTDESAIREYVNIQQYAAAAYIPGQFFMRELPCILDAIKLLRENLEVIVIDGYVQVGAGQPGLGQKLFESLNEKVAVIGVAKSPFHGADNTFPIFRGESRRPLLITSVGLNLDEAAQSIVSMHGNHRIPTMLKRADHLSRFGLSGVK